ncbi:hypothetical protein ACU82A_20030 [Bacillus cereus]
MNASKTAILKTAFLAHNFPSLITEMISWLCFVKGSLLCKEDKKIQTNIVEKSM